jgi:uncharacterized membrane protein
METSQITVSPVQKNIQTIIKLEEEAFHNLSSGERISNAIARFVGRMSFAIYHIIWFGVWALINTGLIPTIEPFDAFPFTLLTTLVSLEAIFLSIFLLINQNAMSRQSDHRAHLDLQVNLLAEQEATQMLRMIRRICRKFEIEVDDLYEELDHLEKKTDVHDVVNELKEKLPGENSNGKT